MPDRRRRWLVLLMIALAASPAAAQRERVYRVGSFARVIE